MSNSSITNYSLQSLLPKDVSGYKFMAWVRSDASVAPFTLPRGIGTSVNDSGYMFSSLGVGVAVGLSPVRSADPLMTLGGVYIENIAASTPASPVSSGQAGFITATGLGEIHAIPAAKTASQVSTSANVLKNASGILYAIHLAASNVGVGNVFRARDFNRDLFTIIAPQSSFTHEVLIPSGGVAFSTSLLHSQTISSGAASMTFVFR